MEGRRRTDNAGRALARSPARRMAGGNSTSIRRHCSQPVASAIVFLHFNGSLLPSQRLIWEEVSRLPPPRRPFNFQKPPRNGCACLPALGGGDWGGGGGRGRASRRVRECQYEVESYNS